MLGRLDGKLEQTVDGQGGSYTDAKSGQVVYAYHAKLTGCGPTTAYLYAAMHDGAEAGVRHVPHLAARPRAVHLHQLRRSGHADAGQEVRAARGGRCTLRRSDPLYVNDNLGSPAAGDTTLGVERLQPLFHLFNGDLCYANLAEDRVRTWWDFWENNSRSARKRPWMPSPGNHENELGNGPIGYRAYQTYFSVPESAGQTDVTRGLWYAFTAGSVRVISIANDDICYQDGGNSYVRGYSSGAQKAWLERQLAAARGDHDIDWIVVCMHQVAISTADKFNGADLGIREEWVPLFDKYGVDLVVCGHEHHYERSHPIRGRGVERDPDAGPGRDRYRRDRHHQGHGAHGDRRRRNVGAVEPAVLQPAAMPGDHRRRRARPGDRQASAGLCQGASAVVGGAKRRAFLRLRGIRASIPGQSRGGITTIKVTYYDVAGPDGQLAPFETFTLRRPRRD